MEFCLLSLNILYQMASSFPPGIQTFSAQTDMLELFFKLYIFGGDIIGSVKSWSTWVCDATRMPSFCRREGTGADSEACRAHALL